MKESFGLPPAKVGTRGVQPMLNKCLDHYNYHFSLSLSLSVYILAFDSSTLCFFSSSSLSLTVSFSLLSLARSHRHVDSRLGSGAGRETFVIRPTTRQSEGGGLRRRRRTNLKVSAGSRDCNVTLRGSDVERQS